MTPIRLFRGSDADGTGYSPEIREEMNYYPKQTVFDIEKINAQIGTIEKIEAKAYNKGVDACIREIELTKGVLVGSPERYINQNIIQRLEQLKKP